MVRPNFKSFRGGLVPLDTRWAWDTGSDNIESCSQTEASSQTNSLSDHSPIGLKRLANVRRCIENVLADGVRGDLIETGAWRGGSTNFTRAVLKVHGVTDRTVWAADSFAGLPAPDADRYPRDHGDRSPTFPQLAVPLDRVRDNFRRYGLLAALATREAHVMLAAWRSKRRRTVFRPWRATGGVSRDIGRCGLRFHDPANGAHKPCRISS